MNIRRSGRGFTLIEIVLVLALAGLLLISVFFAIAGAQRARRDHQRKQDVDLVAAAVMAYAANNNGNIPTTQAEADVVFNNYMTNLHDPLTGNYTFTFRALFSSHTDKPPVGTIYYQQGHWCSNSPGAVPDAPGDPIAGDDTQPKRFVVWTGLEASGGGNTSYADVWACADNK